MGDVALGKSLTVSGQLTVSGATSIGGAVDLGSTLTVSGAMTLSGQLSVANSYGASGQILASQGAGLAPQWVAGAFLPLTGGTVTGATQFDTERIERALALIRTAPVDVRKQILTEASSSTSVAIRNSAKLALEKASN